MKTTSITRGQALIAVGIVMLLVGVVTGFMSVGGSCGSAFSGGNTLLTGQACGVLRSEASRSTWQLIVGGGLLVLVAAAFEGMVNNQGPKKPAPAEGAGPATPDWP
ncbi:hypothetical protein [Terrabacter sp. NPDC000476]|uniref:hypothetical protein n=1 Tax=Terrabacter sp. NPDC000476 TaxID=3154258 RepID=UPI0033243752